MQFAQCYTFYYNTFAIFRKKFYTYIEYFIFF